MANTPTPEEPVEKHPGGRPLKFESVADLELAIDAYFNDCDPHIEQRVIDGGVNQKGETTWLKRAVMTEQKPYVIAGLAVALGVDRKTILNYSKKEQFFPSLQAAKDRCEAYAETQLFGPYSNGAKFNLTNNYRGKYQDWSDRQEVTGAEGAPLMPIGLDSAILARMKTRGDSPSVTAEDSGE